MRALMDSMKRQAGAMDAASGVVRIGVVQSVDPVRMLVQVEIQPEGTMSGWIPFGVQKVGPTAWIIAPPETGTQVVLIPDCGDGANLIAVCAVCSSQAMPPQVPNAIGGPSGTVLPGHIAMIAGSTVFHISPAGVYIKGALEVDGTVNVSTGASGTFGTPSGDTVTVQNGITTNIG